MAKNSANGTMIQKGTFANNKAPTEVYAGEGSNVVKEAKARKRGGKVTKEIGKMAGMKYSKRADRMARKSGGSCVDNPMSSAAKGTAPKGHSTNE